MQVGIINGVFSFTFCIEMVSCVCVCSFFSLLLSRTRTKRRGSDKGK